MAPQRLWYAASGHYGMSPFTNVCCNSTGDLPPGTVVKQRYTIQEVLGRGSNAVTYLGKDNSTGHQVMLTRQQQPPRQHFNLHITLSTIVLSSPGGIFKPIISFYYYKNCCGLPSIDR
jgi:serine/threonine protein kinase